MKLFAISFLVLLSACGKEDKAADSVAAGAEKKSETASTTASSTPAQVSSATASTYTQTYEEIYTYEFSGITGGQNISEGTATVYVTHYEVIKYPSNYMYVSFSVSKFVGGVVEDNAYSFVAKVGVAKDVYFAAGINDNQRLRARYDGSSMNLSFAHSMDGSFTNNVDYTFSSTKQ